MFSDFQQMQNNISNCTCKLDEPKLARRPYPLTRVLQARLEETRLTVPIFRKHNENLRSEKREGISNAVWHLIEHGLKITRLALQRLTGYAKETINKHWDLWKEPKDDEYVVKGRHVYCGVHQSQNICSEGKEDECQGDVNAVEVVRTTKLGESFADSRKSRAVLPSTILKGVKRLIARNASRASGFLVKTHRQITRLLLQQKRMNCFPKLSTTLPSGTILRERSDGGHEVFLVSPLKKKRPPDVPRDRWGNLLLEHPDIYLPHAHERFFEISEYYLRYWGHVK